METLYQFLIAVAGVSAMLAVWVAVQLAWRRSFPEACGDSDVLAARSGCGGCTCAGSASETTTTKGGMACD